MKSYLKEKLIKLLDQVIRSKKSRLSKDDLEKLIIVREAIKNSKRKFTLLRNLITLGNILDLKEIIDEYRNSS